MVAPEGRTTILIVAVVALLSTLIGWGINIELFRFTAIILIVFLIFCLNFFRDPTRIIPNGENLVLSPADGKVVDVSETSSGEKKVSLFLSVFDVHRNRTPVRGKVTCINYEKGSFQAAFRTEASEINEHNDVEIDSNAGIVRVRQIAGILARRIICHLREGQEVKGGESLGFIRFGSRTDLILPPTARLFVQIGDRVKGGSSVLGELH
ncbi:MAG: phosphatidylserine decarboxylase family protein [Candidatus Marinimicrobia bacterium]|nr:phosphatidylserine decarboxylase family protein [Candidatus Neomarinimicrobiota bacterium]|tara:strand:- start:20734 stop:21360 length:627 start_codon:yes stop_codon:yes gene_type:complete